MPSPLFPSPAAPRRAAGSRTYIVLAIGAAAGPAEFARPLGTIAASGRGPAREAARALFPQVAPEELRVVAAAGAPTGLLTRALTADGGLLLAAG